MEESNGWAEESLFSSSSSAKSFRLLLLVGFSATGADDEAASELVSGALVVVLSPLPLLLCPSFSSIMFAIQFESDLSTEVKCVVNRR